jgi:beta-glucuronidase
MRTTKSLLVVLMTLLATPLLLAAPTVLQNVYARQSLTLNGSWNYIVDPLDNGYYNYRMQVNHGGFGRNQQPRNPSELVEYSFETAPVLRVPGDWNTQDDRFFFYEGSMWFKKDFNYEPNQGRRQFLYFGAVNYLCNVYLNGRYLGEHVGGFTPFSFDVTDKLVKGKNFVVVRVNNTRHAEDVPTVNFDWWNYGGITRDVMLVDVPTVFVDDYSLRLAKGAYDKLEGSVTLNEAKAGETVTFSLPELKLTTTVTTDADGKASFTLPVKKLKLWSPETPTLYDLKVTHNGETLNDRLGFRQIETAGKEIRLNGQKVFLKGISIHEEAPFRQGRAYTREEASVLLGWAKEMGCNFVRLAHYPHNEHMVRVAEEMGLMVWSEIPVYWTIAWTNPATYTNAANQLTDMIDRDHNRCAIVIWSIANETPHSDARKAFLGKLAGLARSKDNSRLISMAMEVTGGSGNVSKVHDDMNEFVDIVSFNQYLGWYSGTPDICKTRTFDIPYDKPVFISEFGGGALQGFHGDANARFTEEYQELLYTNTMEMLDKIDGFSGCSPWILVDFHSPRRQLPNIQDFFNRKGLISDRGIKKKAFFVLRDYYNNKK